MRHLGIDVRHAPIVLTYFDLPADYHVATPDLESESWPIRAWRAEVWLDRLDAASSPPKAPRHAPTGGPPTTRAAVPDAGNENLTRFVRIGCFENGPPRRYDDVAAAQRRAARPRPGRPRGLAVPAWTGLRCRSRPAPSPPSRAT